MFVRLCFHREDFSEFLLSNTDGISMVQRCRLFQVNIIFLPLSQLCEFQGCILSVLRFSFKMSPGWTQSWKTWIYDASSNLTGFEGYAFWTLS